MSLQANYLSLQLIVKGLFLAYHETKFCLKQAPQHFPCLYMHDFNKEKPHDDFIFNTMDHK
jgi:hypothetical protein